MKTSRDKKIKRPESIEIEKELTSNEIGIFGEIGNIQDIEYLKEVMDCCNQQMIRIEELEKKK